MVMLLSLLGMIAGLGSLICFILTLIKMFQNDETTMGIVCIVTLLLCGLGGLITFIVGWINASKWQNQQVMAIWTCCFVANIVLTILSFVLTPAIMIQANMPM